MTIQNGRSDSGATSLACPTYTSLIRFFLKNDCLDLISPIIDLPQKSAIGKIKLEEFAPLK